MWVNQERFGEERLVISLCHFYNHECNISAKASGQSSVRHVPAVADSSSAVVEGAADLRRLGSGPPQAQAAGSGSGSNRISLNESLKDTGARKQLITFDNNDPEFDIDSDPDGDLDL